MTGLVADGTRGTATSPRTIAVMFSHLPVAQTLSRIPIFKLLSTCNSIISLLSTFIFKNWTNFDQKNKILNKKCVYWPIQTLKTEMLSNLDLKYQTIDKFWPKKPNFELKILFIDQFKAWKPKCCQIWTLKTKQLTNFDQKNEILN